MDGHTINPQNQSGLVIPFRSDLGSGVWASDWRETASEISWSSGGSPPIRIDRRDRWAAVQRNKAIITFFGC